MVQNGDEETKREDNQKEIIMNHPLIANLNGKERHKNLINEAKNHRRFKAIRRGRGQKETFLILGKRLPLPVNQVLEKTAVE
jgi:hypothetical protein